MTDSPQAAVAARPTRPNSATRKEVEVKNDNAWLTIDQVAAMLNVSYWTVYRLIKTRQIVGVQVGRARRVIPESVEAYKARLIEEAA
ncbi:excisionase family DNA binding protein [Couchioplanes caeruleus]|uniref:Excisionase family DNA binding protein n=1 Tax=Couchioplanes caeruleus TaxID=56438 RepID=A0A3N1GHU7_9ACTN|nr:excisionase family DNA binding protein [Couchioplanes caeruleus]